ncbi:uncharacterized protein LOC144914145 [Branchiostoma floridae x Branchiostoma belcheri]
MAAKAVVGMIPALFGGISSRYIPPSDSDDGESTHSPKRPRLECSEEESDSSGSQYSMEITSGGTYGHDNEDGNGGGDEGAPHAAGSASGPESPSYEDPTTESENDPAMTETETDSEDDPDPGDPGPDDPDPGEPLFPNSPNDLGVAVGLLAAWLARTNVSERDMGDLLKIFKYLLPAPNNLPTSTKKLKRVMNKSIITKHKAHICPNGCCIYTGNNLKQQQCPVCATPRYKDGTKRPRKVFHYYSLIEYLTWLFSTRKFGTLATTHHTRADVEEDDLKFEIQDTEMWKGLYANDGFFQGESRGLSLSVSTDGLSPFRTNPKYGIWPITVTIENLPRSVRNELPCTFLYGIAPGPTKPDNLDVCLTPLVDDLMKLADGIPETRDASTNDSFTMKARVLSWKVDYEGHRILLKVVGASGLAGCDKDHAKGIKPAGVNRTIFPLQRCYLAQVSDIRRNRNGRYLRINDNGQVEGHSGPDNSNPPAPRTHDEMVATGQQVEALRLQGRRAQADRLKKETGIRGVSEICRLPYVDIVADVPVDPMHVIAGFCKKLLAIMRADSSVDGYNIRQFERQMGRFHANIMPAAEGQDLPQAPWTLTPAQLRLADERLACIKGMHGPFLQTRYVDVCRWWCKPEIRRSHLRDD